MIDILDHSLVLLGTFAHIILLVESLGLPNDNLKKVVKRKPILLFFFIFLFQRIQNGQKYMFVTIAATAIYFIIEYDQILSTIKSSKEYESFY